MDKKVNYLEISVRYLIAITVIIIAGIHLQQTLTDIKSIEGLFQFILAAIVMDYGVRITDMELW